MQLISGAVNWRQFLNAFQVEFQRGGGKSAITGSVVSALYSNRTQLMLLFRFLSQPVALSLPTAHSPLIQLFFFSEKFFKTAAKTEYMLVTVV